MERDFALMRQEADLGRPFIICGAFWQNGQPVEQYFERVGR